MVALHGRAAPRSPRHPACAEQARRSPTLSGDFPMRRQHSVMLRLSDDEFEAVTRSKPKGEELASFARRTLVDAVTFHNPNDELRRAASFIVASFSPDITFDEALALFDDYASSPREEVLD